VVLSTHRALACLRRLKHFWENFVSLSDIASVATVASSIAVLISLVYLSSQLRQGARHQMATIHHGRLGHTQAYIAF